MSPAAKANSWNVVVKKILSAMPRCSPIYRPSSTAMSPAVLRGHNNHDGTVRFGRENEQKSNCILFTRWNKT